MYVRLVALVPVLGLVFSGCSQDATPPPSAVPTAASPSASPSPSAGVVPSEATGETPQAAAAFVRYYYTELGKALVSLDTSTVRRLAAPSCRTCTDLERSTNEELATDRRYSGGGFAVRVAEATPVSEARTSVSVLYDALPAQQVTGPGAPSPLPGRRGIAVEVDLVRSGSSWLVAEIKEA